MVKRIYIVGFMGSGKTTFGKKLAKALQWNFVDTDQLIVEQERRSITNIFEQDGETHFRKLESDCLEKTFSFKKTVISTGGGLPCYNSNMQKMVKSGFCIYLNAYPNFLKSRLQQKPDKRPLIKKLSEDEILGFIEKKLKERAVFYLNAQHTIEAKNISKESISQVVQTIHSFC